MGSTVNIFFQGICVHFENTVQHALPVQHRVVLIKADFGLTIRSEPIPPHFASLSFTTEERTVVLPLTGGTLSVKNATGSGVSLPNWSEVPDLGVLSDHTLGHPSDAVLYGKNSLITACWFDFDHGTLTPEVDDSTHTVSVKATVDTTDDVPKLLYKPFPTVIFPQPETIEFIVPTDVDIVVQNQSLPGSPATVFDFYLNYLTAEELPEVMGLPPGFLDQTGGPGCSNSNYP